MFVVDNDHSYGFCSENCIEDFYEHLVSYYETEQKSLRMKYQLSSEVILDENKYIQGTLSGPDEVWLYKNPLKEKFYHLIKKFKDDDVYAVIGCFIFNGKPSFVFNYVVSKYEDLINEYKRGERLSVVVDDGEGDQDVPEPLYEGESEYMQLDLDKQFEELLERKKSETLAYLMENHANADINIEQYHLYEDFLAPTLESPDEVYEFKDDEGDDILTYIRSFEKDEVSFYYIAQCMHYSTNIETEEDILIPIITFPTVDGELYGLFQRGEQITGQLKN